MDSDNVDRQIDDLDTGYQNNIEEPVQASPQKLTQPLPHHTSGSGVPWDKVEMIMQTVVMLLIVAVVGASAYFTLSRLQDRRNLDAATMASEPIPEYNDSLIQTRYHHPTTGLSFAHPVDWAAHENMDNWVRFEPSDQSASIDILFLSSEEFLTKDIITDTYSQIRPLCQEHNLISGANDCQIAKGMPRRVSQVEIETYQATLVPTDIHESINPPENLNLFLIRHQTEASNVIVILWESSIDSQDIHNLINSIQ